jgi:sulfite reductase alpha subunit-like flavoprotein
MQTIRDDIRGGIRTTDQAIAFVGDLKKQGRYQLDVY